MKNKVRLVTIVGMLLIVALALLPFWIRGRRMENRFRADRELFQTTAEAFCNKSTEIDRLVCIYKSDNIEDVADEYGFLESEIRGMKKIFCTSDCCSINAYSRENIGSYCVFDDGGTESEYMLTETGLIYFADAEQVAGRDAEDLLHVCAMSFKTAFFLDEQWIYYESIFAID